MYQGNYEDVPEVVLDASMMAYRDGTVEDALDELNRGSVSVTANGVKTYSDLLNELQALVNYSKISNNAFLLTVTSGEHTIYRLSQYIESTGRLCFDRTRVYPPSTYKITTYTYILEPNNSHIYYAHFTTNYTFDNADASVPNSGTKFTLYY